MPRQNQISPPFLMKVYTFYDSTPDAPPDQAEFIRLWELSWRRRGWKTKILTDREAQKSLFYATAQIRAQQARIPFNAAVKQWLAFQVAGGGHLCDYRTINFGFKPRREKIDVKQVDFGIFWATKKGVNEFVADILTPIWIGFLQGSRKEVESSPNRISVSYFPTAAEILAPGRAI